MVNRRKAVAVLSALFNVVPDCSSMPGPTRSNSADFKIEMPICFWCQHPQVEYHVNCAARVRSCNAAGIKYEEMREEMQENTRRMKARADEYIEDLQLAEATSTGTGASSSGTNDGTQKVGPNAKDIAAAHVAKGKSTGSQPPSKRRRYDNIPETD